ncbi:MAG: hypothetical protein AAF467_05670 [Actinomycetota bacterium]
MSSQRRKTDPIGEVRKIKDPLSRAKVASRTITESQQVEIELARLRREAIEEAAEGGMSYTSIADEIGLSRGRVSQIRSDGPPLERVLFGVGPIDIGLPLRPVEGRDLPVVASEDIRARDELATMLDGLGFVIDQVDIDPRLPWQPQAPDLVAVCGPKSSPTIEEILENDPVLEFKPDDDGRWGITDRVTGQLFVSPMDESVPLNEDVAYVGRVRFDDRRSLFLVAGVHAIGSLGAVHYLSTHLGTIYEQVGTKNFSMVIASENNGQGEIKRSEAACLALPH